MENLELQLDVDNDNENTKTALEFMNDLNKAKPVSISIRPDLLMKIDKVADNTLHSRSYVVDRLLRAALVDYAAYLQDNTQSQLE